MTSIPQTLSGSEYPANRRITVLGIDTGSDESALVWFDGEVVVQYLMADNPKLLPIITLAAEHGTATHMAVERIVASYGGASRGNQKNFIVGKETFDSVFWAGRIYERWAVVRGEESAIVLPRKTAVAHLCGTSTAGDSGVRQALIDRFGGKAKAIGRKATPGPLYHIKEDLWSALGVAVCVYDRIRIGVIK